MLGLLNFSLLVIENIIAEIRGTDVQLVVIEDGVERVVLQMEFDVVRIRGGDRVREKQIERKIDDLQIRQRFEPEGRDREVRDQIATSLEDHKLIQFRYRRRKGDEQVVA